MNIIALCVSVYFKADKEPIKNGRRAGFGPWAACWEPLAYRHKSIQIEHMHKKWHM